MACDKCGAVGTQLVTLLDYYQTAGVKQICPACEKAANAYLRKLRNANFRWNVRKMKQFLGGQIQPAPKLSWWQQIRRSFHD